MYAESFELAADTAAFVIALVPLAYLAGALYCVCRWRADQSKPLTHQPPASVLKPVCGNEPRLYENLKSFCRQTCLRYQIVFGVGSKDDAAIPVIRRLIAEFPDLDIELVIEDTHGSTNPKISNLINIYRRAKHDYLIVADSDVAVEASFVESMMSRLLDKRVGVVTCPYFGRSDGGLVSRLGAMSINEWFMPSVLVAQALHPLNFCLGASVAIRRDVLDRIGGFAALAPYLADDYMLGRLVHEAGYTVELHGDIVETQVPEKRFRDLWQHEVRWMRTVWTMEPVGHILSIATLFVPMAGLAAVLAWDWRIGLASLIGGTVLRALLSRAIGARIGVRESLWLVPVRDLMSFFAWAASFLSKTVAWRGAQFTIRRDGQIEPTKDLLL